MENENLIISEFELFLEEEYFRINDNEYGIRQELLMDIQSGQLCEEEENTTVRTLREISMKKLIELGEVDWKKIYIRLIYNTTQFSKPTTIDLLVSNENYPFLREPFPKYVEICLNVSFCGKLKLKNRFCKNCVDLF